MAGKPARILIVEDEGIVALAIRRSLESLGYEVVATVPTGEEAVRKAQTEHLDLVLMDIRLKGEMLGTEAAALIKRSVDVPIVYLTAYSDEETLRKAKLAQPFAYLVKPYTDRELHAAVQVALYNSALERDRKRAEEAVRARDRLLQDLVDNSPAIITLRDESGGYSLVNHAFERTFKVPRASVRGASPGDVLPALADSLQANDRRVLSEGVSVESELSLDTPSGRRAYVVSEFPLRDPDGKIRGIGTIATDITERKRAEEGIARSERRYRLLAENATDLIALTTPVGLVHYVSPSSARLCGYSPEELTGRDATFLIHPADLPRALETAAAALETPQTLIYRARHRDGHYLIVEAAVRAVVDPETQHGEILLSVNRDVTDRVQAQEELRTLNAELEQRVAHRTQELTAANRELEAFAYAVSHDLRAPLRGLCAYAEALAEARGEGATGEEVEYAAKIRDHATRLSLLVEDLLRLSRAARGEISLDEVDLTAMAREVVDELQAQDPRRRGVDVLIAEGLAARGDRQLLRVVLANLLGNAWKYTAPTPSAVIRFGETETPRGRAFFVTDNGIGFDPSKAEDLFKPFRRLASAQGFEGNGIGLATVDRIIRHHGGQVWAEGSPGGGAAFFFTIGEAKDDEGRAREGPDGSPSARALMSPDRFVPGNR